MKKFKKILAMGLAAVMAISVMNVGIFAAASNDERVTKEVNVYNQLDDGTFANKKITIECAANLTEEQINEFAYTEAKKSIASENNMLRASSFTPYTAHVQNKDIYIGANGSATGIAEYFSPRSGENAVALVLTQVQSQVQNVNVRLYNKTLNSNSYFMELLVSSNAINVVFVNGEYAENGNIVSISSSNRYAFYVSTNSSQGDAKASVYSGIAQ